MMQPGSGVPPPAMAQQPQQYSQQPHQPYMMMPPPPPQAAQAPPMWAGQPQGPPQQTQPSQQPQPTSSDEVRTLWIGDLQYWMEENYLYGCFAHTGEVVSVKVIRNKQTSQSEGYGFIEFVNRQAAERSLQTYNGSPMPNGAQNFRLNWASPGEKRSTEETPDFTIFVGDLAADVTDYTLQEVFRGRFPSVKGAKVVIDRLTGRTKGYGFVRFGDETEQIRAMTEMNGVLCSSRPMRIGPAANKNAVGGGQQFAKGGQNIRLSWGRSPNKQTQQEGSQWNGGGGGGGGYYGYAPGHEGYGYAPVSQDPNMYYGGYPGGYGNYQQPQQQQQQVGYS
ncbi:hypothetical protein F8388_027196 [Cannabis sativa]|uniref:RRM domain-containing protein n=1 Tax=Cannabis sativa TaxID=3483 RepID=A0A7J6FP76_CANSA|nr:hypothetical protein F8388_027196 [Cannabis sativa]